MTYDVQVFHRGGAPKFRPVCFTSEAVDDAVEAVRLALEVLPLGLSRPGCEVVINDENGSQLVIFTREGDRISPTLTVLGRVNPSVVKAIHEEMALLKRGGKRTSRQADVEPCDTMRLRVTVDDHDLDAVSEDLSVVVGVLGLLGAMPDLPILRAPALLAEPVEMQSDEERLRAWLPGKDRILPLTIARFLAGRDASLRGMSQQVNRLMSGLGWTLERVDGRRGGLGGGYRWKAPEAST